MQTYGALKKSRLWKGRKKIEGRLRSLMITKSGRRALKGEISVNYSEFSEGGLREFWGELNN